MKKLVLISSIVLVIGILIVGFAIPILAHDSDDGEAIPGDEASWEAMHEACEEGDWEAMTETAEELHGDDLANIPCHDEDYHGEAHDSLHGWGEMGSHMGGGMMGW